MSEVFTLTSSIADTSKEVLDIAEAMSKADGLASKLEERLLRIRKLMLVGKVASDLGAAGLDMVSKSVDAAKELSNQLALMNALGMSQKDFATASDAAWGASQAVATTTQADNLKALREMQEILGEGRLKDIGGTLPIIDRLGAFLWAETGKEQDGLGADMAKALALRPSAKTPDGLKQNAEWMSRAIIASEGQVTATDFQSALKQSVSGGWNAQFLYGYLPKMIQEAKATGGDATGAVASLAAVSRDVHAGGGKGARPLWAQSGLIDKSGAVKDVVKFDNHPFAWVNEDLRPAVERLMGSKHVSAETAIHSMFTDKAAADRVFDMFANAGAYKDAQMRTDNLDTEKVFQILLHTDTLVSALAEHKQTINTEAKIGNSVDSEAAGLDNSKTSLWQKLGDFAQHHPKLTNAGLLGLTAGSAALQIGGGLLQAKQLVDLVRMVTGAKGAAGAVEQVAGTAEGGGEVVKAVEGAAKAEKAGVALRGVFKAFDAASKLGQVGQGIGRALGAARLIPMVLGLLAGGLEIVAAVIASPVTWIVALAALIGVAVWQIAKHWNTGKGVFDNIKAELGMFWDWLAGGILNFIHMIPGFGGKAATAPAAQVAAAPHPAAQVPPMAAAPGLPGKGKGPWEQPQRPALVAPRQDGGERTHSSPVYLDGKKVGQIITRYLAHEAGRAQSGASGFDPTMGLTPVGMGYGPY